jgi:serine/threonine protein kinase
LGGHASAEASEGLHLQPGAVLGPFRIVDRLGAGGMGEVYRALDSRLGRKVALKVLPRALLSNQEGLSRFALEARSASALNHPNIVTIFEVGQAESSPYLAMELIDGWTLRHLVEAGPLPVKKALELATQIASGLAKAHQAGIVHRDLKPENIMVTQDGFVKILDFGLAKLHGPLRDAAGKAAESLTQVGLIIGTPDYMSPEQAAGRPLDLRSDQFSFGLVLYEMLTRRCLFHRATPVQTLSAIIQDELPSPLEGLGPSVPPPLRWVIERCLAKDPSERYLSTHEIARELKQIRDKLSDFRPTVDRASPPSLRAVTATGGTARVPTPSAPLTSIPGIAAPSPSVGAPAFAAKTGRARRVRDFAVAFAVGLALFAGGAWAGHWFHGRQAGAPPPIWKANLLVGPTTTVIAPRSSPDGQTLAFLTLVAGRAQVAVMKPSSGDWTVLTRRADAGSVSKICWSRDGDKLFFDRVSDIPRGIFSVPPLGGEERTVLEDAQSPEALPTAAFSSSSATRPATSRSIASGRTPASSRRSVPPSSRRVEPGACARFPTGRRSSSGAASPARKTSRSGCTSWTSRRDARLPSRRSSRSRRRSRSRRTEAPCTRSRASAIFRRRSPCRATGSRERRSSRSRASRGGSTPARTATSS